MSLVQCFLSDRECTAECIASDKGKGCLVLNSITRISTSMDKLSSSTEEMSDIIAALVYTLEDIQQQLQQIKGHSY